MLGQPTYNSGLRLYMHAWVYIIIAYIRVVRLLGSYVLYNYRDQNTSLTPLNSVIVIVEIMFIFV